MPSESGPKAFRKVSNETTPFLLFCHRQPYYIVAGEGVKVERRERLTIGEIFQRYAHCLRYGRHFLSYNVYSASTKPLLVKSRTRVQKGALSRDVS